MKLSIPKLAVGQAKNLSQCLRNTVYILSMPAFVLSATYHHSKRYCFLAVQRFFLNERSLANYSAPETYKFRSWTACRSHSKCVTDLPLRFRRRLIFEPALWEIWSRSDDHPLHESEDSR